MYDYSNSDINQITCIPGYEELRERSGWDMLNYHYGAFNMIIIMQGLILVVARRPGTSNVETIVGQIE